MICVVVSPSFLGHDHVFTVVKRHWKKGADGRVLLCSERWRQGRQRALLTVLKWAACISAKPLILLSYHPSAASRSMKETMQQCALLPVQLTIRFWNCTIRFWNTETNFLVSLHSRTTSRNWHLRGWPVLQSGFQEALNLHISIC